MDVWPWLVGFVAVMLLPELALRRIDPEAFGWLTGRLRRRRAEGERSS